MLGFTKDSLEEKKEEKTLQAVKVYVQTCIIFVAISKPYVSY